MVLLELLWSFVKIGFTSFGGLSMIPLISDEMLSHGWMTALEVSDIVAIAEMTPGPVGLNCATFAGIRAAGLAGAAAANLGVLLPSLTLCAAAAVFFARVKDSELVQNMMVGVRPACFGLICATVLKLGATNYSGPALPATAAIGLLDVLLLLKFRWSVPRVLAVSALLGLLLVH
jgi:chromate transporter